MSRPGAGRPASGLNVRALVAIAVLVVWAALVVAVTIASSGTAPSQFDYDDGARPPSTADRQLNVVTATVYVATFPVALVALWVAASSLRLWREQMSATIAVVLAGLAALAGIGVAALGVGRFVFFT
jgi:hypothetical protein